MAQPVRIVCPDAKKLAASMGRAADEVADMPTTYAKAAALVVNRAKGLVPVETGRLGRSIGATKEGTTAVVTAGGPGVPYAGPIHWGWEARNIEAQPFLSDALDQVSGLIEAKYREDVESIVDKIDV